MVLGPIDGWTAATLDELVSGQWQESMVLEFKRELGTARGDRKETAKDISAFANTSGGWLIYGIDEQANAQGIKVAGAVMPLADASCVQRVDDIIAEAVVPPVRYRSKAIAYGTGVVLVLRIEPSTSALHMVQAYDDFRYYRRTERAARPMSEPEVRQALDLIARRDLEDDQAAHDLFDRVSAAYPAAPYGWVALSTGIRSEVLDPRAVTEPTISKYLHHDYPSRGAIGDIGYRSTLGENVFDFGVARDGSVWLKWPLGGLAGEFKPFILIDNVVRLCAYAVDLWNENSINPRAPRLALQLRSDEALKVYDGMDRYRPLVFNTSKWLTFVVSRSDLQKGSRLKLARTLADRVYQILGQSHCPFFTTDGNVERFVENEMRSLPL